MVVKRQIYHISWDILGDMANAGAFLALVKVVISQWYSSQEIGIAEKLVFKINTNIKIGSENMKKRF